MKASAPRPGTGPYRARRLPHERLSIGAGGHRHVAALAVGDEEEAGFLRRVYDGLQCGPAGRAEALEAGDLRLDGDAGRAGGVDHGEAVALDGGGRALGGAGGLGRLGPIGADRTGPDRARPQRGRVGVEAQHDLAAALLYERREPVGETRAWAFAHLLTFVRLVASFDALARS